MSVLLVALLATALLLGWGAGPVLDRYSSGTQPGTAIGAWLGAVAGTFAAVTGAVMIALLWPPTPGHGFVEWLHGCLPHHRTAATVLAGALSMPLLYLCGHRLMRTVPRLRGTLRRRRDHREMLHMVAHEDERHSDVLLLDHPIPVAYCLPSRRRPIVLSTGAQRRLSTRQLAAVLEHERAHLRQRHHLVLLLLDAGHALLPWSPTVRRARSRVPLLLEMAADDAAARTAGHRTLADALRRVGSAPEFAGVLAASGSNGGTLTKRLARLEGRPHRPGRAGRPLAWALSICATIAPLFTAAAAVGQLILPC
ncbi:M56 family metallopeptidase [Actinomadura sediminis]|uniref:M56 family metallopeptidase n=1 Tax=Actinomadura sediminis TaxID=1038904 RepID=A0ABW3ET03_9ACTN